LIAVFDASVLIFLFEKDASGPLDTATGLPLTHCYERVNHLIETLTRDRSKIIIPTPSLAEILVKAGDAGPARLRIISENRFIRIVPFDLRASAEFAAMQRDQKVSGTKRTEPRPKSKFDDQIIAIAKVEGAGVIYSSDIGLAKTTPPQIEVISVTGLPLPPEDPQMSMSLEDLPTDKAVDYDPAAGSSQ
jgi:predicted nucleic acid-binding protein